MPEPTLRPPTANAARAYRPPVLLRDLRLLDALELTGTTEQAGRWLAISQPTVSRRCRLIAYDFGLRLRPRQIHRCRVGSTLSLRQLRLSARWHRFEAGVLALGADPVHQGLLTGLHGLLPVPPRFRSGLDWLELVRHAVIDAALVSSLELEEPELDSDSGPGQTASREGQVLAPLEPERLPLGQWPLRLVAAGDGHLGAPRRLLVPPAELAPGFRTLLDSEGPMQECTAAALHNLTAWRSQLAAGGLVAAIPAALLTGAAGSFADLQPVSQASELRERLWLLLPPDWPAVPVLRLTVESLRWLAIAAGALPQSEAGAAHTPSPA